MQPDQLIARFQQRDESAFAELYERYSENILGVIYSVLHDQELSEEVLQDVFIKAWNNASSYNSQKGRFFTWLLNIARNAAIDKTRSKSFKNNKQNQNAAFFVDILEDKNDFSSKVDAIGIKKYIDVLEPICKKVIHLLFFKGYTQKETAEELDIPLGTVKTRNRICINKLRNVLGVT
ncbi:sigma-70 family RNA polymerase sigma factor [uncultured Dokdonia sp.]|uniref:RNA polymerase sigma factor n=1 Tax=uncultured Dokdonia sp. TaxID=575653 RepID=UPI00261635D2|nr:sigma-70 family RNA polymerase sigma factor [uncultured Dokdonia sp.]